MLLLSLRSSLRSSSDLTCVTKVFPSHGKTRRLVSLNEEFLRVPLASKNVEPKAGFLRSGKEEGEANRKKSKGG